MSAADLLFEIAKQIVTVASGLIALTVTFAKNVGDGSLSRAARIALGSWLLAIVASLWVLLALTAQLAAGNGNVWAWNVRLPMFVQIIAFGLGLVFFLRHAFTAPGKRESS